MRLASSSIMQSIVQLHSTVRSALQNNCHICLLAKQTRLKFPLSTSRAETLFHIVHMDFWGPYKIPIFDRKQYFLIIVDDHSRYS